MVRKKDDKSRTDKRVIQLVFPEYFPFSDLVLELRQIDIIKIIKALRHNNNKTLINKLINFIKRIDKRENIDTVFYNKIRSDKK